MFQTQSQMQIEEKNYQNESIGSLNILTLKDQIISMTHRITSLQQLIINKMDRIQCMNLLQRKVNGSQFKKSIDEIKLGFIQEKRKQEQFINNIQQQHRKVLESIHSKLNSTKKVPIKKNIKLIKPQQLYLESNETMFSLVIQQMDKFQMWNNNLEKLIENKHKNTINLNNQVCRKINKLELQIEQIRNMKKGQRNIISQISQNRFIQSRKGSKHNQIQKNNESYEAIRLDIISNTLENIQKQLLNKTNLRDILNLINKNSQPVHQEVNGIKAYVQESLQSMRKILLHQSEINQEVCSVLRIGMWQGFNFGTQENVIWQKQWSNMYPQGYQFKKSTDTIHIINQGTYFIKVHYDNFDEDEQPQQIYVLLNDNSLILNSSGEKIISISKNTSLSLKISASEVYIFLQRL